MLLKLFNWTKLSKWNRKLNWNEIEETPSAPPASSSRMRLPAPQSVSHHKMQNMQVIEFQTIDSNSFQTIDSNSFQTIDSNSFQTIDSNSFQTIDSNSFQVLTTYRIQFANFQVRIFNWQLDTYDFFENWIWIITLASCFSSSR
jgi:N-acetylmuramoyl-L-alanine amidase CwlA